ncbi:3\-5\ exonuclease family protein [Plasmopara halstedii]|uniref:3\-5\ exonuclease family protein n=1 Tax=Plasmopara halstedii TaxID=4781 RepID=A0A0P1A7P7_PLAHL|nr:3\-5\ exonuclease family protein [Plasmopara halstedii]CEG36649.1 3\-5\ exonuclease family protein [Plasmopara halstedii]|eukprot:XP_024573018.1 3\-5\ exonuclease family protein [Plasmopara halstedii]
MISTKVRLTELINQSPQYRIDQSRVPIYFVANKKGWSYCATRLLKAQILGLDTETRPIRSKNQRRNPCALLQIAVRDASEKEEVFILDLLHLSVSTYNTTLTSVFLSKKIVKLGQSFFQDLQELAQSYPSATCFTVCKSVVEVNDLSISLAGAHNPLSLQKLVFVYLNRKLAKKQQMSNWARRPLTQSQLHYAAADALVLIHLHDELLLRIRKQRAAKRFRLRDVANILDVNLPRTLKCSLCFDGFKTADELKRHRQLCILDIRTLLICKVCGITKLWTQEAMADHLKRCGEDASVDSTVMQSNPHHLLSVDSLKDLQPQNCRFNSAKSVQSKKCFEYAKKNVEPNKSEKIGAKKKRSKRKAPATDASSLKIETTHGTLENKKRKLSMESSLLASDSMWLQISSDCNSFITAA